MSKKLYFITENKNKVTELKDFFAKKKTLNDKFQIHSLKLDIPEIQGTAKEVIAAKLDEACKHVKQGYVLVDDTGLCFEAMKGLPGVYIKHFINAMGCEGVYRMLDGFNTRKAVAECHFGFCEVNADGVPGEKNFISGAAHGMIVSPRGLNGFGFDPIFEEITSKITFAQMTMETKNKLSHRGDALTQLCRVLHDIN